MRLVADMMSATKDSLVFDPTQTGVEMLCCVVVVVVAAMAAAAVATVVVVDYPGTQ